MKGLKGALMFAQSGGPTSVINASAAGVFIEGLQTDAITAVYGADVQVRFRNGLAGLDQAHDDFGDVLSHFMELLHLKTAGEELVLQLLRSAVDVYIFF